MTGQSARSESRALGRPGSPSSTIDARDGAARAGVLHTAARRRAARPRSCRSPRRPRSSRCTRRGRRARLRHGARQHLPPLHPAGPRADRRSSAACTSSWAGGGRSSPTRAASRSSRWATARWPRRSSGARDAARVDGHLDRRGGRPLPLLHRRRASASWAPRPRWRCRRRSAPTSRSPSTSARPSTPSATTPRARWSARTAGSTAASPGTASTRRRASCSTGSSRAASTRTCAPSPTALVAPAGVDGIAIGGSLGQEKEQMREVVGWALRRPPRGAAAPPARDRRRRRHRPRRRRRHRHVRLRDARRGWPATAPRSSPTRRAAGGSTWPRAPTAESREPIDARCPCPACREHTRGYLHYLSARGRAHGEAAADAPQPDLHGSG